MGHTHLETQTLACRFSSSDPQADMTPGSFSLPVPTPLLEFPSLRDSDHHSSDGSYPNLESTHPTCRWATPHFRFLPSSQFHWWDFPHSEATVIQLCCWNFPIRRSGSSLRWWVPSPFGVDASNLSTGHTTHFRTLLSLQVSLMRLPPLVDNIADLPKHQTNRPYQWYKLNTLEKYDHQSIIWT